MTYFFLEPEVAGGLGPRTIMDRSLHPPVVSHLHFVFDGWLGDEILESFPCFIVTERLWHEFQRRGLTGVGADVVEISTSEQFLDLQPQTKLPDFVRLKIIGTAGRDDFGIGKDSRLVVSEVALNVIQASLPKALEVTAYAD